MKTQKTQKTLHAKPIQPLFRFSESGKIKTFNTPGFEHIKSTDIKHATAFLSLYANRRKTFISFCAEIERFLLWCEHQACVSLKNVTAQHLITYERFLADPKPRTRWLHTDSAKRELRFTHDGGFNPQWRPFAGGGLAANSIRKSTVIVDRFFRQLEFDGYIKRDPRPPGLKRAPIGYSFKDGVNQRYVTKENIELALGALTNQGSENAAFYIARTRYLVLLLYYTGLRINEVAAHTMGQFSRVEGEWFLKVRGKGKKERRIPVPDEFIDVLVTFRRLTRPDKPKLSQFPHPGETTPLVPNEDFETPIGVRRIDQIIKKAFWQAATKLGDRHPDSDVLRRVSAHWLRHSYGTYLARAGTPLQDIKENLGHASLQTTTVYIEQSDLVRHQNTRGLSIKNGKNNR